MKRISRPIYEADDGQEFDHPGLCRRHDLRLFIIKILEEALEGETVNKETYDEAAEAVLDNVVEIQKRMRGWLFPRSRKTTDTPTTTEALK